MGDVAIGVGLGNFRDGEPEPAALFRYVERADELGIDSIWMPDHAISQRPALDPTVLMSVIAARTQDIKMGPSVMTLPARNPVTVANTYANLDHLTGGRGRVIVGVGLGADPRLCEVMGVSADQRADRLREAIEIMRRLWTEDDVDYDGDHHQLEGVTVTPKPAQGPLDIWLGGNSNAALRRVARYGDGWFPALLSPEAFDAKLERLMSYCDDVGRTVERDEAGVILLSHVDEDPKRARTIRDRYFDRHAFELSLESFETCSAFGTPADCVETIQRYVDAGCTKFVLSPVGPFEDRVEQLERYSRDVIPAFS
ncbi:LLM class flavin-dependent oxidoreductase [Salinadaptatus halalkaliphilus]|uniref:LLM class flavin-dependent oxidoreductase n=1 Tax=Salinadaptatus halalkaliphilus TaxID=2419781 RepID=A0A4S3TKB4_9EURY|nr:LLM class flavin-dependent oxidoreductase [Salinadaptatus halalkaliphilus]THE63683.1 LLM class flavin-dependent oxidoreductase [Salinadaptatus halalkaliphilus]